MNKKQLPSKREIIPASSKSATKARATFTDEFKRKSGQEGQVEATRVS
jgi:transposase